MVSVRISSSTAPDCDRKRWAALPRVLPRQLKGSAHGNRHGVRPYGVSSELASSTGIRPPRVSDAILRAEPRGRADEPCYEAREHAGAPAGLDCSTCPSRGRRSFAGGPYS